MKRSLVILGAAFAAAALSTAALAAEAPTETPFPAPKTPGLFVAAQTVTATTAKGGLLQNFFQRGQTVVFRVFAADAKTGTVLRPGSVKYAYIKIPGQPNLKLSWTGPFAKGDPDAYWPWRATWTVPNDYTTNALVKNAAGVVTGWTVEFKVLVTSKQGITGSFVQAPVTTAQLTVRAS